MDHKPPPYADMPLPDLLRQLSTDTATLLRQEIALARAELSQILKRVAASAGMFGVAAIGALGAFGAFTAFLILVISLVIPAWAAALVVTVLYGIVAAVGALAGKKAIEQVSPVPQQTVETVKQDVEAVKAGVRRGR